VFIGGVVIMGGGALCYGKKGWGDCYVRMGMKGLEDCGRIVTYYLVCFWYYYYSGKPEDKLIFLI